MVMILFMARLWSFMFYYKHECPRMVMNNIFNGSFMVTYGYKNNRPLWMVAGSSLDDVCFSDLRNT